MLFLHGSDTVSRPARGLAVHPRSELRPARPEPLGPAMVAMETFRKPEGASVHHLVGHDPAIATDRTAGRRRRAKPDRQRDRIFDVETVRVPNRDASLDRKRHGREHALDAFSLGPLSFSQSFPISRARQTLAPTTSRARVGRRCAATEISLRSTCRSSLSRIGPGFDSIHHLPLRLSVPPTHFPTDVLSHRRTFPRTYFPTDARSFVRRPSASGGDLLSVEEVTHRVGHRRELLIGSSSRQAVAVAVAPLLAPAFSFSQRHPTRTRAPASWGASAPDVRRVRVRRDKDGHISRKKSET
jgi:hypothetical protein